MAKGNYFLNCLNKVLIIHENKNNSWHNSYSMWFDITTCYDNPTSKQQLDMQNKNKTPISIESDVKTGDAALLGAMACGV